MRSEGSTKFSSCSSQDDALRSYSEHLINLLPRTSHTELPGSQCPLWLHIFLFVASSSRAYEPSMIVPGLTSTMLACLGSPQTDKLPWLEIQNSLASGILVPQNPLLCHPRRMRGFCLCSQLGRSFNLPLGSLFCNGALVDYFQDRVYLVRILAQYMLNRIESPHPISTVEGHPRNGQSFLSTQVRFLFTYFGYHLVNLLDCLFSHSELPVGFTRDDV